MEKGRRSALRELEAKPGESVLEVGVGTGLSLPHWNRESLVTGIDLCPEMLGRAEKIRRRHRLENVELQAMDAQDMEFPDSRFDKIAAMYVVSVVEDPASLLNEIQRVGKPGARVVIINHFEHRHPLVRKMERAVSGLTGLIGFNAALPLDPVMQAKGFRVLNVQPANWLGYWTMITAEVEK